MKKKSLNWKPALLCVILIVLSTEVLLANRFWGRSESGVIRGNALDGSCVEYYVESYYVFWIKVSEETKERSCGSGDSGGAQN